jgi:hypothetical protein
VNDEYFMNKKLFLSISGGFFGIGILFYLFFNQTIIIRPRQMQSLTTEHVIQKKKIELFFQNYNELKSESTFILWQTTSLNIEAAINAWLSVAWQEKIITKKAQMQSAAIDIQTNTVYLSFDRSLFEVSWSIIRKLKTINCILKTIETLNLSIQTVYFLVHHEPLIDQHLDFSIGWPISGFLITSLY